MPHATHHHIPPLNFSYISIWFTCEHPLQNISSLTPWTAMLRQRVIASYMSSRMALALVRAMHFTSRLSPPHRPTVTITVALRSKFPLARPNQFQVLATAARTDQKPLRQRGRFVFSIFALTGFTSLVLTGAVIAFFVYDATTYKEECDESDIGMSEIALKPRRGGPKNLPIAEVLVK